jgi:tetratricopeptide (TPR) repeat protein
MSWSFRKCPHCRSSASPRFTGPVDFGPAYAYALGFCCSACNEGVLEVHGFGPNAPGPRDCLACDSGKLDLTGRCRNCDMRHEQLRTRVRRRFGLPPRIDDLGEVHERGEHRLALHAMNLRLQADPDDVEARVTKAELMIDLLRPEQALPLLRGVLARGTHPDASIHLGIALANAGQPLRAIEVYERYLAEHPDHPGHGAVLSNIGGCLSALGHTEEGERYHRRAIVADPEHSGSRWNLMANLFKQGRVDEALEVIAEATALPFHTPEIRAELHAFHAQVLRAHARPHEALAAIDASLASAPNRVGSLLVRGELLHELNRLEQARVALLRALELAPGLQRAQNLLERINRDRGVHPS